MTSGASLLYYIIYIIYHYFYMHYSTPLFNNVPTHVTVDFACALCAGSTVTCVYIMRQGQLDTIVQLQYLFQHYKCSHGMKLCAQTTFVKVTKLILQYYGALHLPTFSYLHGHAHLGKWPSCCSPAHRLESTSVTFVTFTLFCSTTLYCCEVLSRRRRAERQRTSGKFVIL